MSGLILILPTQELVSPDLSKLCPFDQVTTLCGEKDKKDVQGKPGRIVWLRAKSDACPWPLSSGVSQGCTHRVWLLRPALENTNVFLQWLLSERWRAGARDRKPRTCEWLSSWALHLCALVKGGPSFEGCCSNPGSRPFGPFSVNVYWEVVFYILGLTTVLYLSALMFFSLWGATYHSITLDLGLKSQYDFVFSKYEHLVLVFSVWTFSPSSAYSDCTCSIQGVHFKI